MDFACFDAESKAIKFVNFECPEKNVVFPIGELMLTFLDLDFTEFESKRQAAEDILDVYSTQSCFGEKVLEFTQHVKLQGIETPCSGCNQEPEKLKEILALAVYSDFMELVLPLGHVYFDRAKMDSPEDYIRKGSNFAWLQRQLSDAIEFCLDVDNDPLNRLSASQRYLIYQVSNRNQLGTVDNIPFTIHFDHVNPELYPMLLEVKDSKDIPLPVAKELIEAVSKERVSIVEGYNLHSVRQSLLIEFIKMVQWRIKVRKCKNCGQYFILKGNYNAQYCDRILPSENRTCYSIGATKKYQKKVANDPILREYTKAYKRNFARYKNRKMSQTAFEDWVRAAKTMREEAMNHRMSCQQFKSWLGNK